MVRETDVESFVPSTSSSEDLDEESASHSNEDDPSTCSVCLANDRPTEYVENCKELKSIIEHIESSSDSVRKVKYACQTCLYKFYTVIDQSRLKAIKAEREHRLATVAALIESTNTSQASEANTASPALFARVEEDDIIPSEDEIQSGTRLSDKEAYSETEDQKDQQQSNAEVASIPSVSSQSHLDVMFEQCESALITESGGTMEQYKNPPLQCRYCPKMFVLKKPYQRHMRSHETKMLSARSASSTRGRTPPAPKFACNDCSATFESSAKLKSHCRIHLKRYYCTYCHKENFSLFDHEFHEAECKGEHMAKQEVKQTRPVTRSRTRSLKSVKATSELKFQKSSHSKNTSSWTMRSHLEDEDDDSNADGYTTSVAYTDITGLNSYIENWVAGTCSSEFGNETLISQNIDPNATIVSKTEFDIIMLERLIKQAERNVYKCFSEYCDFSTNILSEMILHEVVIHKYKTYFHCRKCKGVFTTKVFHDYHLYLQNYGKYRCNKCTMLFNFEYELHYHLVQHQKSDSYPCLFCGNTFMSGQELRIHCLETGHQPRKRKRAICIDHTMTIENERAPEPQPVKRTYKCTIKIMNLPKPPKRSHYEVWEKGKRKIFLGDIDFEYQPGRNCVQTK